MCFSAAVTLTLTRWPSYMNLTWIPQRYPCRPKMNFLCQDFRKLSFYIQTNIQPPKLLPCRLAGSKNDVTICQQIVQQIEHNSYYHKWCSNVTNKQFYTHPNKMKLQAATSAMISNKTKSLKTAEMWQKQSSEATYQLVITGLVAFCWRSKDVNSHTNKRRRLRVTRRQATCLITLLCDYIF